MKIGESVKIGPHEGELLGALHTDGGTEVHLQTAKAKLSVFHSVPLDVEDHGKYGAGSLKREPTEEEAAADAEEAKKVKAAANAPKPAPVKEIVAGDSGGGKDK